MVSQRFGGCARSGDVSRLVVDGRNWNSEWQALRASLTKEQLQQFVPDQGGYLDVWPADATAAQITRDCRNIPAIMVSCWGCLCHDVLRRWPDALSIVTTKTQRFHVALDELLREHGEAAPPSPWYLFQRVMRE